LKKLPPPHRISRKTKRKSKKKKNHKPRLKISRNMFCNFNNTFLTHV
jgi:hypothetical protein